MSWKRFAAWATGLEHNPFESARLRLTAFYIFVVAIILAAFSLFLYFATVKNINDTFERENNLSPQQQQILADSSDHLQATILGVDTAILLLTAILSYLLAGKTLRPIKHSLDTQAQFTADASHEFRTPLAIIKYNGDVALKNPNLKMTEAREVIQSSIEEANHMSVIVERLLMLAREESNWNNLEMQTVDLTHIVQKAVKNMRVLAERKNIDLRVSLQGSGSVHGNADALDQMVLNILQNAIDYTPSDGRIEVSVRHEGPCTHFVVKDTGIGIEEKDLPHIFKRFYKSDRARTLKQGGGLGLSIVQTIVQKHNGTVTIASTPGNGTEVVVRLPRG